MDCSVLTSYTNESYAPMNALLRGTVYESYYEDEKSAKAKISRLDKVFEEAPTVPSNLVAYREMSSGIIDKLKPGDIFQDKGFVSTTIKKDLGFGGDTKLEIRVPKGTKGIYIAPLSYFEDEQELLLNRNTKFKIIEKTGNKVIVEVVS